MQDQRGDHMNARANTAINTASEVDLRNQIDESLRRAKALVLNTYGESGEGFRKLANDIQDDYMDAINGLLLSAESAWNQLDDLHHPFPQIKE